MSTRFWRVVGETDPARASVPGGSTSVPRSDMIQYKEHLRTSGPSSRSAIPRAASRPVGTARRPARVSPARVSPATRKEHFSPNLPYADQYYVYTPYISLKSTPVPLGQPGARAHMGGHPAYPSLSYNITPGITTRDSDVALNQPYWYRHNYGPSYDQMWEYNMTLHQQYLQDVSRARRMRHLR